MEGEIDRYIKTFTPPVRKALRELCDTIRKEVPQAGETIKYGMPTFVLHGNLVHFAGYKNHIGFYPTPSAIEAFKGEISQYKWSKGAVRFPLGEPLPLVLVARMVRFRVAESRSQSEK